LTTKEQIFQEAFNLPWIILLIFIIEFREDDASRFVPAGWSSQSLISSSLSSGAWAPTCGRRNRS